MTLDRRTITGETNIVKGVSTAMSTQFASIQERRVMKKVAQPEHAYTGCVPYTPEDNDMDQKKKRNPPILGYRGHLRHSEDRIGTTFTQGLAVASQAAEPVLPLSNTKTRTTTNQPRQVHFADDKKHQPNTTPAKAAKVSPRSGYGQFNHASGYGNFAAPPLKGDRKSMSPRSGYGAFDNASGYGAFAAAPPAISPRSGYGQFDNASGYGAFAAPPARAPGGTSPRSGYGAFDNASGYGAFAAPPAGMSPRSGYGEFDNASGYGAFTAPPAQAQGEMSPRSGYGAFDDASGYGAFAAPPQSRGMSPRSGYGAFDNASGYGAFAAPPKGMSTRSGYGAFENASGYGAFAAPPDAGGMSARSGYGEFENTSGYGAFATPPERSGMSPRSGYGKFDDASGYGNFASPPIPAKGVGSGNKRGPNQTQRYEEASRRGQVPGEHTKIEQKHAHVRHHEHVLQLSSNQSQEIQQQQHRDTIQTKFERYPCDPVLQVKYQQAILRVGGERAALHLWTAAGQTVWQRHKKRTELLQAVKRSFEKHERINHGFMTKAQLKEALRDLACVFTDDQITALFGMYDKQCTGSVAMSELLVALTDTL